MRAAFYPNPNLQIQGAVFDNLQPWISSYYSSSSQTGCSDQVQPQPSVDDAFCRTVWNWLTTRRGLRLERRPSPSAQAAPKNGHVRSLDTAAGHADAADAGQDVLLAPEEHIWRALTGHGPDPKKVPPLRLQLLSIIAAHGSDGVTQPTLVRLSGQDKRSVPKRTDTLHEQGYIDKRSVVDREKHLLTSQCILKKFVAKKHQAHIAWTDMDPPALHQTLFPNNKSTNLPQFLDFILATTRHRDFVPAEELRERLDVRAHVWQRSLLLRILARVEKLGVISMGRIRIERRHKDAFVPSIQFVREPTEEERLYFGRFSQRTEEDEASDDDQDFGESNSTNQNDVDADMEEPQGPTYLQDDADEGTGRWQPDTLIQNQVFERINEAGPDGLGSSAMRTLMGWSFYRKPFEVLSNKVSAGRETQPSNLQHLAIVRDVTISGRNLQYKFRSYKNMETAVAKGEASWEAVGGTMQRPNSSRLDQWGFPELDLQLLGRKALVGIQKSTTQQVHSGQARAECTDPAFDAQSGTLSIGASVTSDVSPGASVFVTPKKRGLPANQDLQGPATKRLKPEALGTGHDTGNEKSGRISCNKPTDQLSLTQRNTNSNRRRRREPQKILERGLHINPPDWVLRRARRPGRPRKWTKTIVFKFEWLEKLPWFTSASDASSSEPNTSRESRSTVKSHGTTGNPSSTSQSMTLSLPQERSPGTTDVQPLLVHVTPRKRLRLTEPGTSYLSKDSQISTAGHASSESRVETSSLPHAYRKGASHKPSSTPRKIALALNGMVEATQVRRESKLSKIGDRVDAPAALLGHTVSQSSGVNNMEIGSEHGENRVGHPQSRRTDASEVDRECVEVLMTPTHESDTLAPGLAQQEESLQEVDSLNRSPNERNFSQQISAEHNSTRDLVEKLQPVLRESGEGDSSQKKSTFLFQSVSATMADNPLQDDAQITPFLITSQPTTELQANEASLPPQSNPVPLEQASSSARIPGKDINKGLVKSATFEQRTVLNGNPSKLNQYSTGRTSGPDARQSSANRSIRHIATEPDLSVDRTNLYGRSAIRDGGHVSHERYATIFEILNANDGVYPCSKEIWWAYASAVRRKKGRNATVPDQTTLSRTLKTLCTAGTLRKITFDHETRSQTTVKLKMIAFASISDGDERLTELAREMRTCFPRACFPGRLPIDPEFKVKAGRHLIQGTAEKRNLQNVMWSKVLQPKSSVVGNGSIETEPAWVRWYKEHLVDSESDDTEQYEEESVGEEEASMRSTFQLSVSENGLRKQRKSQQTPARKRQKRMEEGLPSSVSEALTPSNMLLMLSPEDTIPQRVSQPCFPICKATAAQGRQTFMNSIRALTDPLLIFHGPSGTFASIYEVRPRQRRIAHMTIDTKAPARFEAEIPDSLEDILASQAAKKSKPPIHNDADVLRQIDQVAQWEKENESLLTQDKQLPQPRFITCVGGSERHCIPSVGLIDESGMNSYKKLSQGDKGLGSKHVFNINAQYRKTGRDEHNQDAAVRRSRFPGKYNRVRRPFQTISLSHNPPLRASDQRLGTSKSGSLSQEAQGSKQDLTTRNTEKEAMPRGVGPSDVYTEKEIQRIIIVVVTTRIIVGGSTRYLDWALVDRCLKFDPKGYSTYAVWQKVRLSRKKQIQAFEDSFPEAYLDAYERGEVASVDYHNLAATDWEGIFTWASQRVADWHDNYALSEAAGENETLYQPAANRCLERSLLPASRAALEHNFVCDAIDSSYNPDAIFNPKVNDNKVRGAQLHFPFELPIRLQPKQDVSGTTVAKSVLRAYSNTPANDKDLSSTRDTLCAISEQTLQAAEKSLETDGVVEPARARRLPDFDTLEGIDTLLRKCTLRGTSERFQRAIRYKRELDTAFTNLPPGGRANFSYFAGDADVMVVINLAAMRMVRVILDLPRTTDSDAPPERTDDADPADIRYPKTMSLWGSPMSNTRSAKIDPTTLVFRICVEPTSDYKYGLPPLDRWDWDVPIRSSEDSGVKDAIPAWCGMQRQVLSEVWHTVIVGLVCFLASRPNSTVENMARAWEKKSSMEEWEIGLALKWLAARGIVGRIGEDRWRLAGWWWCLCGESGWTVGDSKAPVVEQPGD